MSRARRSAEESDPTAFAGFEAAPAAWFVDPLDGTREFVARNGEFAVMIGLAERGAATLGVIVCPARGRSFAGVVGEGAYEVHDDGSRAPIRVSPRTSLPGARVVVSRSRTSPSLVAALERAGAIPTPTGSSGLKAVLVACGEADAYLHPGRAGMLWDACAGDALVCAAGGTFTDAEGGAFDYAAPDLVNARGIAATNGALYEAAIGEMNRKIRRSEG